MKTRWIIPGSLAAFALITTALWAWLSFTHTQVTLERVALDELDEIRAARPTTSVIAANAGTKRKPPALQSSKRRREPLARSPSLPPVNWQALGERVDEQSVRLRLRAGDSSFARSAAGWAHLDADRPHAALAEFDRVLKRSEDDPAALKGRAEALARLQRFDEAISPLQRAAQLQPNDADTRYNFGALLYRLSRFTEASEQFREVVSLRPGDARAWFNLAGLAQRDGRLTEARDAWERFTSLQPDVADGWFNLGLVRFDLDDPIGALFDFSCAAVLAPSDQDIRINIAAAWETLGDPHAALEILHDLHALHPCDPFVETAYSDLQASLLQTSLSTGTGGQASANGLDPQHDRTAALPSDEARP